MSYSWGSHERESNKARMTHISLMASEYMPMGPQCVAVNFWVDTGVSRGPGISSFFCLCIPYPEPLHFPLTQFYILIFPLSPLKYGLPHEYPHSIAFWRKVTATLKYHFMLNAEQNSTHFIFRHLHLFLFPRKQYKGVTHI